METEQNVGKVSTLLRMKRFFLQSKRVYKITKKPSNEEYKMVVKVTGIGMLVIGAIGFLIHFVWKLVD